MSYTDEVTAEVLNSVKKIGIAKTSRLFNISTATIKRWLKKETLGKKETLTKNNHSKKQDYKELVVRKIAFKNSNDNTNCHIYNIIDLQSGLEFNCIAYYNIYRSSITLFKYFLRAYIKETNILSYQIRLKGFNKIKNLENFSRTYSGCKIEFVQSEEHYHSQLFYKKKIIDIQNEGNLIHYLTDEQLCHNISQNNNQYSDLQYLLPINLDKFYYNNLLEYDQSSILYELTKASERILTKAKQFLYEANYQIVLKYLEIVKVINKKAVNQKNIITFYTLKITYYQNQGDYQDALTFLHKEILKINNNNEVKFLLIISICNIYLRNYDLKKFDYYQKKINSLYSESISGDILLEYDLLISNRKSVYLPIEESILAYKEITQKHKHKISQTKLFEIYIEISRLYHNLSNFGETNNYLEKCFNLPIAKDDKYLLCEYYLWKCERYLDNGLYNELKEYCYCLKNISKEQNYKTFYYHSIRINTYNLLQQGFLDEAKIEADKYLNYGIMTSNKRVIYNAYNLIAAHSLRSGDIHKALKFNKKQIELSKSFLSLRTEIDNVNNRCVYLSKSDNKDEMLPYLEKMEKSNKIVKDVGIKIRTYTLKACYFQYKKENHLSLKYYTKALNQAKINNYQNLISTIYSHIAIIKRDLKEFKSAIYCIDQSISYYDNIDAKYDLPRLLLIKAKIYFEANNITKAKICLSEAKKFALDFNNQAIIKSCSALEEVLINDKS